MNKISAQASACAQREDKEWKYQKKRSGGGLVCIQTSSEEFTQLDRSGRVEAAAVPRSEFVHAGLGHRHALITKATQVFVVVLVIRISSVNYLPCVLIRK